MAVGEAALPGGRVGRDCICWQNMKRGNQFLPVFEACSPPLVSTKCGMVELLRAPPGVLTHDHKSLPLIEPFDSLARTEASCANRD